MRKMFETVIAQFSKYNVNMNAVIADVVNSMTGR